MTKLTISPDLALPEAIPLTMPGHRGRLMRLSPDEVEWALRRIAKRTEVVGDCWEFTGYTKQGYGVISIRCHHVYVHRFACALVHGDIPTGADVCHRCDNRPCWRPEHLFAGTRQANVADCWSKGRAVPPPRTTGERHYKATLTDAEVASIREAWVRGDVDQRTLAAAYGVSQSTIWRIIHREVRAA